MAVRHIISFLKRMKQTNHNISAMKRSQHTTIISSMIAVVCIVVGRRYYYYYCLYRIFFVLFGKSEGSWYKCTHNHSKWQIFFFFFGLRKHYNKLWDERNKNQWKETHTLQIIRVVVSSLLLEGSTFHTRTHHWGGKKCEQNKNNDVKKGLRTTATFWIATNRTKSKMIFFSVCWVSPMAIIAHGVRI